MWPHPTPQIIAGAVAPRIPSSLLPVHLVYSRRLPAPIPLVLDINATRWQR